MSMNIRLKDERERLGFTQPRLAELLGVGKTTVINWEKGSSAPDAIQLGVFAAAGADVSYVITGQRSQAVAPQELLPEGDRVLLDNFHAAPPQVQAGIKTALGAFAPDAGSTKRRRAS